MHYNNIIAIKDGIILKKTSRKEELLEDNVDIIALVEVT